MELFKKLSCEIGNSGQYSKKTITDCLLIRDKTDKVDTVVISTHGLVKKSGKTPPGEIEKAEAIRKMYFDLKM